MIRYGFINSILLLVGLSHVQNSLIKFMVISYSLICQTELGKGVNKTLEMKNVLQ